MPELTADQLIDKELFANKKLIAIDATGKTVKIIMPGASVGIVYSWITKSITKGLNSPPYLMFYDDIRLLKNPYYVKIEDKAFKLTEDIKKIIDKETTKDEKQKLQDKGAVLYYFQKFAPYIIGTIIVLAVIKKKL